jgi:hypothetical protein
MTGAATTYQTPCPAGGVKMETFVPWKFVRRGIKRQVILPTDAPAFQSGQSTERAPTLPPVKDSALLRAIGLAHYWQLLIDTHKVQSAAEIAAHEEVNITQVRRLMRLTLLSPSHIESIASQATQEATLDWILRQSLPNDWCQQDSQFPSRLNKALMTANVKSLRTA